MVWALLCSLPQRNAKWLCFPCMMMIQLFHRDKLTVNLLWLSCTLNHPEHRERERGQLINEPNFFSSADISHAVRSLAGSHCCVRSRTWAPPLPPFTSLGVCSPDPPTHSHLSLGHPSPNSPPQPPPSPTPVYSSQVSCHRVEY